MIKIMAKGNTKVLANKAGKIIKLLSRPNGAKINDISRAADSQTNNVRGLMAVKLKRKVTTVASSRDEGKVRRYEIVSGSIQ